MMAAPVDHLKYTTTIFLRFSLGAGLNILTKLFNPRYHYDDAVDVRYSRELKPT